jgi:hypothetical protein
VEARGGEEAPEARVTSRRLEARTTQGSFFIILLYYWYCRCLRCRLTVTSRRLEARTTQSDAEEVKRRKLALQAPFLLPHLFPGYIYQSESRGEKCRMVSGISHIYTVEPLQKRTFTERWVVHKNEARHKRD